MKTVKILSLTLLMSVFCVSMTFAQQQQERKAIPQKEQKSAPQKGQQAKATAEERASKQVDTMKKSLNLSNDQTTKLQAVQTQFIKDQDQARASKTGNQQDLKAKRDAYDAQVKSILTPDQYQKYQDQRSNMKKGTAKQGAAKQGQAGNKGANQGNHKGNWNKDKKAEQTQNN